MKKIAYILLIVMIYACSKTPMFTKAEQEIINSGDTTQPMRVLLITDKSDSLFLRQRCKDIEINPNDKDLQHLIKRMRITMDVEGGIGIAANQVGVGRNLLLITRLDKPDYPVEVVINPQIVAYSKNMVDFDGDGCLSIPNQWGVSKRYESLKVSYYNEQGKLIEEEIQGCSRPNNFTAIIFQHEFDHLQGILYIDRIVNEMLYDIPIENE